MSFQSLHFVVFAVLVFAANALLLRHQVARKYMLLAASYYFYMCWDWRFASLLLVVAVTNYVGALGIQQCETLRAKRIWLAGTLLICLGVLAFFKYANFFIESFLNLLVSLGLNADLPMLQVVLPIGVSFFTFQGISYTIDVYRKQQQATRDLPSVALLVAYFPTVLSGPITRARELLPQFASPYPYRSANAQEGIFLVLRGLSKKIFLADVIALHIVTPAFSRPQELSTNFLLVGAVAYSFQIYMDLSGYTDIARGVSKTLGFELPENFNLPYRANSVSNFWQRWHISMSSFFRDYLYFGIGGSKHGNVYANLLVTFTAIGLWHGAGWNFVAYGILHGLVVGAERYCRTNQTKLGINGLIHTRGYLVASTIATFLFVAFSRVLFRSEDLMAAGAFFAALGSSNSNSLEPFTLVGVLALALSIVLHYVPRVWNTRLLNAFTSSTALLQASVTVLLVLCMLAVTSGTASFVYFQF